MRKRGWQAAGRRPRCREEAPQAAGSGEECSLSDSRPLPPGPRSRGASPWQTVNTPESSPCDPWVVCGVPPGVHRRGWGDPRGRDIVQRPGREPPGALKDPQGLAGSTHKLRGCWDPWEEPPRPPAPGPAGSHVQRGAVCQCWLSWVLTPPGGPGQDIEGIKDQGGCGQIG